MSPPQQARLIDIEADVADAVEETLSPAPTPVPIQVASDIRARRTRRPAGARTSRRPRILMTTEGTYPHAVGGVSSWCELVIGGLPEFDWQILPIVAGDRRLATIFELPAHAKLVVAATGYSHA
jgi:hypothetical protein